SSWIYLICTWEIFRCPRGATTQHWHVRRRQGRGVSRPVSARPASSRKVIRRHSPVVARLSRSGGADLRRGAPLCRYISTSVQRGNGKNDKPPGASASRRGRRCRRSG